MAADRARARQLLAATAGAGALTMFAASFAPWVRTDTETGGATSIDGWGGIDGDNPLAGANLNDVLDGVSSFRPGLIGTLFGALAVVAAVALASVPGGPRPHRITAAVLALCGLMSLGWGVWRGVDPGSAGVFDAGESGAGWGAWLTALGGLLTGGAAVPILRGRIDPPVVPSRRGIQPRR